MSNGESPDSPPPFEDAFHGDDVEQRVYGTILQTREPTTASAIAELADCDLKAARKYLGWCSDLGIVTRHEGHPATYERNDDYFEWRGINQLAAEFSVETIIDRVEALEAKRAEYEARFETTDPTAVNVFDHDSHETIHERMTAVSEWQGVIRDIRLYELGRQLSQNDGHLI